MGERGTLLSGGQRQRLALARALVKNPAVLILDEATSAVDNETERAIQRSLDVVTKDRTTPIVAHRLSTIRRADCIYVLEAGKIVEQGAHDALLLAGGRYAELWRLHTGERLRRCRRDKRPRRGKKKPLLFAVAFRCRSGRPRYAARAANGWLPSGSVSTGISGWSHSPM